MHRQRAGLVDIDALDLTNRGRTKRECYGTLADFHGETYALRVGQSLRVVDARDRAGIGRHYHGACDNGPSDGPASYLVNAREERSFDGAKIALDRRPALTPSHFAAPAGLLRLCSRLCRRRLATGHEDLGFPLSDAGGLACEVAQIVQLRATDASTANDRDLRDHRAVDRENALDADAVRDLANRERRADARAALCDANTLKSLESFLVALADAYVDAEGVPCSERGNVVAEPLFLGFNEGMHMTLGAGVNSLVKTCLGDSREAPKSKPPNL
jgi:hypothetical protein